MKKIIFLLLTLILSLLIFISSFQFFSNRKNENNNSVIEIKPYVEVNITPAIQEMVIDTKNSTEDLSTTEIIESTIEEEKEVTDESALEIDAQVEQENISYDGDNTGNGLSLLGPYQGLTYYSQADSRWANKMYSSKGDPSQTMKSSACGPTCAAMVVSSSKGAILPTTMAEIALANGYRTANNGTAWAFYPFVADYFDFKEYRSTSSFNTAMEYLAQKKSDGSSKYYIIASCGSGCFTSGGHYIVLAGLDGDTIKVFDPYLYNGKFNTVSRRPANITVSGNTVYITKNNFKAYANYKNFWIYSNDSTIVQNPATIELNYIRYVATQSAKLNVRTGPGTGNAKIGALSKGQKVNVVEIKGGWSRINSPLNGWVSNDYLSAGVVSQPAAAAPSYSTTIGKTYKLKGTTTLYSKPNAGKKYTYKRNTTIKVISHYSSTIDYIYVPATKRYAYCNISAFGNIIAAPQTTTPKVKNTIGKYYRFKNRTNIYSNSNLSGKIYNYLPNTQVKVIKNINNSIDYVRVVKTGRYGYVNKNSYK